MIKLDNFFKKLTFYMQLLLNIILVIISLFLVVLVIKETIHLGSMLITKEYTEYFYKDFLKGLLTFFIYFEFILLIIKYFKEDYHFPLRYFMYIGITATIRLIVVDHESALETLFFSLSILVLVIGYGVISYLSILKDKSDK